MSERQHKEQNRQGQRHRGPGGPGPGGGGPHGMMPGEKAKDFKGTIKKLISYLKPHLLKIMIVWILAIGSTVFMIVGPKILGNATNELFAGVMAQIAGTGGIDFTAIGRTLLFVLGLYAISAVLSYFQGFIMNGITNKISYTMRNELNAKIHRLPFGFYDTTTHGDILSRITNDVDTISQSLNQSITQIITSIVTVIGVLVMMLTISWQMTIIALCSMPISMVLVMMIVKKSQKHFFAQQRLLGEVNGHVEEIYGSHVVVKAFNGEKSSVEKFDIHNEGLYKAGWKANFLTGLLMPLTGFIGNIAYVVICVVGGSFAASGSLMVGDIQAFIQYVRNFNQPVNQLANISNVLQQTAAAAERVFEFLAQPEEIAESKNALTLNRTGKESSKNAVSVVGSVEFENVAFGYNPDTEIIHDFSALIKPGQKIAIVGPTGAGKTTIVKLLMRFYDVDKGKILIDGHDIRDFKRDDLRSLFGMVLQDTWLFGGTIADNIRYGKLDATMEEITSAAQAAHVDHFVRTLPNGYEMVLSEEASNISQGQKQLLTIARAILADPEILILDEATSSVDTRTEVLIQKAMDTLMEGRTSFIIAHRLSTIRGADLILVMRDGDIVEQGNHEELLAKDGFYASLYNSQFENAG